MSQEPILGVKTRNQKVKEKPAPSEQDGGDNTLSASKSKSHKKNKKADKKEVLTTMASTPTGNSGRKSGSTSSVSDFFKKSGNVKSPLSVTTSLDTTTTSKNVNLLMSRSSLTSVGPVYRPSIGGGNINFPSITNGVPTENFYHGHSRATSTHTHASLTTANNATLMPPLNMMNQQTVRQHAHVSDTSSLLRLPHSHLSVTSTSQNIITSCASSLQYPKLQEPFNTSSATNAIWSFDAPITTSQETSSTTYIRQGPASAPEAVSFTSPTFQDNMRPTRSLSNLCGDNFTATEVYQMLGRVNTSLNQVRANVDKIYSCFSQTSRDISNIKITQRQHQNAITLVGKRHGQL